MPINHLFNSLQKYSKEHKRTNEEAFSAAVSLILVDHDIIKGVPAYIDARKKADFQFLFENNPVHVLVSGVINAYCDNLEKAHNYFEQVLDNYCSEDHDSTEIAFLNAYIHFELAKVFLCNYTSIDKSTHFKKAVDLYTQLSDQKGIGECLYLKANFYGNQKNFISALENYKLAAQSFQLGGHTSSIAKCYLRIAETNAEISNHRESEWYLNLASDKVFLSENATLLSEISYVRAKGLFKQNKIEDAIHCLCGVEGYNFTKENLQIYINQFSLLVECYTKLNQASEAHQYDKMAMELRFNLSMIEKELVHSKNQVLNLFEKYELELLIQEKNNIEISELKSKLIVSKEENDRLVELLSHDFKEPIRVINSFASLLQKNISQTHSDKDKEYIQFILNSATKMSGHIDNLLKYIQLDTETCEVAELNLNEVLDEVKHELSSDIDDKKAIVVSSNLPNVKACKDVFNVLFYNLVENAIKFNHNTPIVKIDYTKKNNQHEFSVSDNGIGIADDDKEKVFDLFRKINKTNEFEGWGVGLSVSKKIVNSLGGQIQIEDNPNGGTKVKFILEDGYILN